MVVDIRQSSCSLSMSALRQSKVHFPISFSIQQARGPNNALHNLESYDKATSKVQKMTDRGVLGR